MVIKKNVNLAQHTYYQIGGPAQYFIEAKSVAEVKKAIEFARQKSLPLFILGGGTNVLVSDSGFDGVVIKCQMSNVKCQNNEIVAGAGVSLQKVVNLALDNNLKGLEWAAGIPGTIGGAVRGNCGAFGHSISEIVKEVKVMLTQNQHQTLHKTTTKQLPSNENFQLLGNEDEDVVAGLVPARLSGREMEFDYRTSRIKQKGGIILEVVLGPLEEVRSKKYEVRSKKKVEKYLGYRKRHQPLEYPSCGSVFTHTKLSLNKTRNLHQALGEKASRLKKEGDKLVVPAGVLIEECGLKGKRIGDAQISKKHANFIVNLGQARASDVYELIKLARQKAKEEFGVKLELEVELLGFKR